MLKKSLIFGSVALFLAALITLMGCPTEAETDSGGGTYKHRIYGISVDPYQVQDVIDKAVAAGEPVYFENGLSLQSGHINFKTAKVIVAGNVGSAGGLVINAADADVTWGANSSLSVTHYIYQGQAPSGVPTASLVEFKNRLDEIMPTATAAAVRKFKLGTNQNYDYSTSTEGVNARTTAPLLKTLYVIEELVVPSGGAVPGKGAEQTTDSLTITAMGTLDVTGTPTALDMFTAGTVQLGTSGTLTSSTGNVNLTIPNDRNIAISNIKVDEGKDITLQGKGAAYDFTIAGRLTGAGTLKVGGDFTSKAINIGHAIIGGGDGNVQFTGDTLTVTNVKILSSGKAAFDNALTINDIKSGILSADYSWIAGDVVFKEGLNTTGGTVDGVLYLYGNVSLNNEEKITLGAPKVYLDAGKTVKVGGGKYTNTGGGVIPLADVLTAGPKGVTLAPTATAVLTAGAAISETATDEKKNLEKKLTLGTEGIEIFNGTLEVAQGGILAIDKVTLKTHIDSEKAEIGYLSVADGGTINLIASDASKLVIGETTIAWGTNDATLTASGGAVSLGNNTIGSAEAATLAVTKNDAAFTIDDGSGTAGGKILTVSRVNLDLGRGSLTIKEDTAPNRLILENSAKLTLNTGDGGTLAKPRSKIAGLSITGDFIATPTAASAESTNPKVLSLAHGGGAAVNVTGLTSGDTTLNRASVFTNN
jgi:hypothetical protein